MSTQPGKNGYKMLIYYIKLIKIKLKELNNSLIIIKS